LVNTLARVLATCPDAELRDGPAAVRLAERAAAQTGFQHPAILATLAAAYAEAGTFDKAVDAAKRALRLAQDSAQRDLAQALSAQLALYEAGQPYRSPEL
jgi:tetratricopeptide (TPR) repeat protein